MASVYFTAVSVSATDSSARPFVREPNLYTQTFQSFLEPLKCHALHLNVSLTRWAYSDALNCWERILYDEKPNITLSTRLIHTCLLDEVAILIDKKNMKYLLL